ncbi:hypothetical protein BN2475_190149 [Paraburkholderia ribeironis]|uniref:Uncharacterized protein n=1 Tax=Paraburkholderia ribeironis TaxID=1247936 RepID=A0A1N7RVV3_9BURK|nr:hypothetical protein BN2475_190149 [Paraburkholderia ribeironis]
MCMRVRQTTLWKMLYHALFPSIDVYP